MRLKGHLQLDGVWHSAMRRAPATVQQVLRKTLRQGAQAVRQRGQAKAPRGPGGRHPDKLRKSLRIRLKRLTAYVYSSLWYSRVQEEGSDHLPGGVLKPKRKKWLHFRAPDGKWVRVKQVRVKGQFFLRQSLDESQQDLQAAIDEGAREVARKVFGG